MFGEANVRPIKNGLKQQSGFSVPQNNLHPTRATITSQCFPNKSDGLETFTVELDS